MKRIQLFRFLPAIAVIITLFFIAAAPAEAEIYVIGQPINCDPALPPNAAGGCGLNEFILGVRAVISFLIKLALPLVGLFIAWGGFVILTARGSQENVAKGKKIITAAGGGLVVCFSARLAVFSLYQV